MERSEIIDGLEACIRSVNGARGHIADLTGEDVDALLDEMDGYLSRCEARLAQFGNSSLEPE